MPATPPVDLATLKERIVLDEGDSSQDADLTAFLIAATEQVEKAVGPMVPRDVTDTLTADWCGTVIVATFPVVSLSAVSIHGGATVDLAGLGFDVRTGIVSGLGGARCYDVTYSAGRDDIPESLKEATVIVATQLFQTKLGPEEARRFAESGLGDTSTVPVYRGFAWPNRAAQLVEPYRLRWAG